MPFSAMIVDSEVFDASPGLTFSAMLQGAEQLELIEGYPLRSVSGRSFPQQDRSIVSRLKQVTGVNFLEAALQELFTCPAGKTTLITQVVLECTTGVGVTIDGSAGAGNSLGIFNMIPNTTLTNFRATGDTFALVPTGLGAVLSAGQTMTLSRAAATGTTLIGTVSLFGIVV